MRLRVSNMNCPNCVKKITDRLEKRGLEVSIDLDNKIIDVDALEVSDVILSLKAIGYEAELVD